MRPLLFLFFALAACCAASGPANNLNVTPAPDTVRTMWVGNLSHILLSGRQANVWLDLDPALYTREGSEHYYLHFTVYNRSGKTYGFDLGDPGETIFLNQVVAHESESLIEVHSEIFNRYLPLKEEECTNLLTAHQAKTLQFVETGRKLEYYREFTGGKKEETRQLFDSIHHLSLYLNGRLAFTDGEEVCEFIAQTGGDTTSAHTCFYFDRSVKVTGPIEWKTIPEGALVIPRQQVGANTPKPSRSRR